jgi:hypothetical protein
VIKTAAVVGVALLASGGTVALAQSPAPQAYALKAEGKLADRKLTVTIVRDGARERVEQVIEIPGRKVVMATLYDFEARRVYWIGWSGAGTCSSGRYLSARAPVGEDPITGTADNLAELTKGRSRKAAGTGTVAGRPARIEAFVGGKRPADPDEPWPTRVWLAEDGGYLLKLEGEAAKGKPMTLLEVTQLTLGKPAGAQLQPPPDCVATNSDMTDDGSIRSSATASVGVQASASADLATGATSATVTQAGGTASRPPAAGALAKTGAMTLSVLEQPHDGACGKKLKLTGAVEVDGPATLKLQFVPSGSGAQFPDGPDATVTVDAAGSATLVRDAIFARSFKGQVRLRSIVRGTKGHDGPLRTSDPVTIEVTCAGK